VCCCVLALLNNRGGCSATAHERAAVVVKPWRMGKYDTLRVTSANGRMDARCSSKRNMMEMARVKWMWQEQDMAHSRNGGHFVLVPFIALHPTQ
jgi:hypothetical protein